MIKLHYELICDADGCNYTQKGSQQSHFIYGRLPEPIMPLNWKVVITGNGIEKHICGSHTLVAQDNK